jgi:hypothetical protein
VELFSVNGLTSAVLPDILYHSSLLEVTKIVHMVDEIICLYLLSFLDLVFLLNLLACAYLSSYLIASVVSDQSQFYNCP